MQGLTLDFLEEPSIDKVGINNKVGRKSGQNSPQIMLEVNKLLKNGIVINPAHEEGKFISPTFLRSKPDGTNRVILNFKTLNQTLEYNHFKMEAIHSVAYLIQQNYYMLKIGLKEAYYSVKILEEHTKYLTSFQANIPFLYLLKTLANRKPLVLCRFQGI